MSDWDDFYERQCPDLYSLMNSLFAGVDISMPKRCLACGTLGTLHAYYHSRGAGKRGGFWMWCSACRRFMHASCIPPQWWQNLESCTDFEISLGSDDAEKVSEGLRKAISIAKENSGN